MTKSRHKESQIIAALKEAGRNRLWCDRLASWPTFFRGIWWKSTSSFAAPSESSKKIQATPGLTN
jgi:hypothetical protein